MPSEEIIQPKLLLVEGREEVNLFLALMNSLGIGRIQVKDLSGRSSFPVKLRAIIQTPGFEQVTSLGVVRDADTNADDTYKSIINSLRDNGLPVPDEPMQPATGRSEVTVLIVPHGASSGMLEDVCLDSVRRDPAMDCVAIYFDCLREKLSEVPANMAKARAHAFLASRRRPDLRVGEAAQAGYWNFNDDAFEPLKRLISLLKAGSFPTRPIENNLV